MCVLLLCGLYCCCCRLSCSLNATIMESKNIIIALMRLYCFLVSSPKLNYTIMYNATRALKIQQLVFGSPDKPDGRSG